MAQSLSAKRYAQAIFELAIQEDQVDQWAEDLQFVAQVLSDEEFGALLRHADVPQNQKTRALDSVLTEIHPMVRNLGALLVTRGAVNSMVGVSIGYKNLLDEYRGRQQVEVTSAVPLTNEEVERIRQFVADIIKKEVVVVPQVDEDILGGVIIQIGDRLLDGSTRARLEGMRKQIKSEIAA